MPRNHRDRPEIASGERVLALVGVADETLEGVALEQPRAQALDVFLRLALVVERGTFGQRQQQVRLWVLPAGPSSRRQQHALLSLPRHLKIMGFWANQSTAPTHSTLDLLPPLAL
jgi:hypothetical protein